MNFTSLLQVDLHNGNDVRMPNKGTIENPFTPTQHNFDPTQAIADGKIDRGAAMEAARRVFNLFSHLE